jgi:hypothetical protein
MTVVDRSRPAVASTMTVALLLVAAGCASRHFGAPCSLGVAGGDTGSIAGGSTVATINPASPDCPDGLCVLPAAASPTDTGPLCAIDCASDQDCGGGEVTSDPGAARCKSGFACMVITTVGPFCCRKLCACRDFAGVASGPVPVPAVCLPGAGAALTCPNVM